MSLKPPTRSMSQHSTLTFALLLLAGGLPVTLAAQSVENPVIPRGSFLLQAGSSHTQVSRVYDGQGGTVGLAGNLRNAPLTPETFPALEAERDRLRELIDDPGQSLSMGSFRGRFEVNEQHTPLRVGWGATDRFTIGVTVPFVRRQVTSSLLIDPEGGNMGRNPAQGPGSANVTDFRNQAGAALGELQAEVQGICELEGPESEPCQAGQAAAERVSGFLGLLDAAWSEALLFPLSGSGAGTQLSNRWASIRQDLADWGAEGPETLPLATRALSPSELQAELVDPVWGTDGFPSDTEKSVSELGDVQFHLVVGLLQGGELGEHSRFRIRSALELTARFPTGVPDSMTLLTPLEPPRGYGGGGFRWISDLRLDDRFALLSELEWESFMSRDHTLMGVNPADPWSPEAARQTMEGAPGDRLRVRLTPRLIFVPGLSFGAGWEWEQGGEGHWSPVDAVAGVSELRLESIQRQRASVELRFAGWETPVRESIRFPIEVLARASWSFTGSEGAPRDRRFEIGARVLRGAP